jgi:hypothetical protein
VCDAAACRRIAHSSIILSQHSAIAQRIGNQRSAMSTYD